jgi:cytochrome c biogenesis protein CcmG/thiol:disulfide interchange protein DsbE
VTQHLPPYVPMRRLVAILAGLALVVLLVVGLRQAGSGDSGASSRPAFDLAKARHDLAGSPAPLAALHDQSSQLLGGGPAAFHRRLGTLKGYPVVVNKWASWCAPCRTEFPIFQSESVAKGKQVAFLGVNAGDSSDPAHKFLRASPLPFPSYVDPEEKIAKSIQAPANYPITVFFDARGRQVYSHQGGYRRQADLAADLKRYLKQ